MAAPLPVLPAVRTSTHVPVILRQNFTCNKWSLPEIDRNKIHRGYGLRANVKYDNVNQLLILCAS